MTFKEYINDAWAIHADQSSKLMNDFKNHFSLLESADDVTSMAHLVTHVSGEHLGHWKEGIHLLNSLKTSPHLTDYSGIDRYIAALSLGENPKFSLEHFSDSDQVRILGMTASALASQNDIKRAGEYLERAHEIAKSKLAKNDPANRGLAIAGNNLACALEEKSQLSHDESNLMIQAAYVGRKFWEIAGTWKEVERAEYRLAHAFLKADVLDKAFEHAEKCLAIVAQHGNEPLEVFFGFEVMGLVEKARRNQLGFEEAKAKMTEAFNQLSSDDKSWCQEILNKMK
jgi:hypothetical protein